jgi:hypothetical protein
MHKMKNKRNLMQICSLHTVVLLALPASMQAQFGYSVDTNNANTITITNYTGSGEGVTIPTNINGMLVTGIGNGKSSVFSGSYPISVTIPDSVNSIDDYAFSECASLSSLMIPHHVTKIGEYAFMDCLHLTSIEIPGSVTNIGNFAFCNCARLARVTIPGSVIRIGEGAFCPCSSLTNAIIADGVTSIGPNAFNHAGLTSITIPGTVTSIGYAAFKSCSNLTNATIVNGVITIGDGAFQSCPSLTGVFFKGNAPSLVPMARLFDGDKNAIVYYQPDTTGWGPTFGGCPTKRSEP